MKKISSLQLKFVLCARSTMITCHTHLHGRMKKRVSSYQNKEFSSTRKYAVLVGMTLAGSLQILHSSLDGKKRKRT